MIDITEQDLFDAAHAHVAYWEGGFVDNPNDPGGATNHGISLRFLKSQDEWQDFDFDDDGDLDRDDVKLMSVTEAKEIYQQFFWDHDLFSLLYAEGENNSLELIIKLYDLGVNMGESRRSKLLQSAINHIYRDFYYDDQDQLEVDGIFGFKSRTALMQIMHCTDLLYALIVAEATKFYFNICEKRPASRAFLYGWLRRAYDVPSIEDF